MLIINRLKIEIKTENGIYGFDKPFKQGLNLIASENNTCGKSSIIEAIYYCLGLEEIIGGRGEKVLTSVYKTSIEDGDKVWPVLESGAYLEISNGNEIITIFRAAKMENRDSRLITVFYSALSDIDKVNVNAEDMYVHLPNSATSDKGFHNFLEHFMHLELPLVPASDDINRKLYLQLVFSCMFIEQKHGWADIFSGMPILGIKESKKRVLEFILHLDTLDNEQKKEQLRNLKTKIESDWNKLNQDIINSANKETCVISGLPVSPQILTENDLSRISIFKNVTDFIAINDYISGLEEQYNNLKTLKPKIVDNFDQLQNELEETEASITSMENELSSYREKLSSENIVIRRLNSNIEIINSDLQNNKDAAKLKKLGANLSCLTFKNICPLCNQEIQDTLLPNQNEMKIMSIDDNIRHLEAQKKMLTFALNSHNKNKEDLKIANQDLESRLFTLRRLAKTLRSDLYSTNDDLSETIVYKRLKIESEISNLNLLKELVESKKKNFLELSKEWANYLKDKSSLPSKKFTELDAKKIDLLRTHFIQNLKMFGYKSILNLNEVAISLESYLPIIEGFDMKFDSSASDNIRAIWAFTLALVQTSIDKGGNHPNILIFDEPDQHSIIINDMEQFFKNIISLGDTCQVLVGITIKDSDTRLAIEKLQSSSYHIIKIEGKAFQKIENNI